MYINKEQKIIMSNELYEYKNDDNYGKVYIILPKPEKGLIWI